MLPGIRRAALAATALILDIQRELPGCPRAPAGTIVLDQAVADGDRSARSSALAGFHAYLVRGDPAGAAQRFERALERDRAEPYALAGMMLLERRRGHPERSLAYALDLCE